jgi:hypothetical protein
VLSSFIIHNSSLFFIALFDKGLQDIRDRPIFVQKLDDPPFSSNFSHQKLDDPPFSRNISLEKIDKQCLPGKVMIGISIKIKNLNNIDNVLSARQKI